MVNPSTETGQKPNVKCTLCTDEQLIYLLAKAGWFNGDPSAVDNAPIDKVINAYYYEIFSREYEATYIELNKDKK